MSMRGMTDRRDSYRVGNESFLGVRTSPHRMSLWRCREKRLVFVVDSEATLEIRHLRQNQSLRDNSADDNEWYYWVPSALKAVVIGVKYC